MSSNLAFLSLSLELKDNSISFGKEGWFPNEKLIYRTGVLMSNVLNTINLAKNDCITLKICGMMRPGGVFEIAMGVIIIHQYLYAVHCIMSTSSLDFEPEWDGG